MWSRKRRGGVGWGNSELFKRERSGDVRVIFHQIILGSSKQYLTIQINILWLQLLHRQKLWGGMQGMMTWSKTVDNRSLPSRDRVWSPCLKRFEFAMGSNVVGRGHWTNGRRRAAQTWRGARPRTGRSINLGWRQFWTWTLKRSKEHPVQFSFLISFCEKLL